MKNKVIPYITLLILITIAILYYCTRVYVHTFESYLYASGIDNFMDIKQFFSMGNPAAHEIVSNHPAFNIYHPNHPLLHLLAFLIFSLTKSINPLDIIQMLNLSWGIVGIVALYKLLLILNSNNQIKAIAGSLFLSFTNLYWYQSVSGEVYIAPTALMIITCIFLFKTVHHYTPKNFYSAATCWGIALAFHQLSIIFFFPLLYVLILLIQRKHITASQIIRFCSIPAGICLIVYFVPFLFLLKDWSLKSHYDIISIYSHIFGFWQEHILVGNSPSQNMILQFQSIAQSFLGDSRYFNPLSCTIAITCLISVVAKAIEKDHFSIFAAIWISSYFMIISFFIKAPTANDYVLFFFPPIVICFFLSFKLWMITPLTTILLIHNAYFEILPKHHSKNDPFFTSHFSIPPSEPIHFLGGQPFNFSFTIEANRIHQRYRHQNPTSLWWNGDQSEMINAKVSKRVHLISDIPPEHLSYYTMNDQQIAKISSSVIISNKRYNRTSMGYGNLRKRWNIYHYILIK